VQAVMAALASADTDDFGVVELSLTVPPDDRDSSPWYTAPENPIARAQKERMAKRRVDINEKVLGMVAEYYGKRVAELVGEIEQIAKTNFGKWDETREDAAMAFEIAQSAFKQGSSQADWHALADAAQNALEALLTDETLQFYADKLKRERANLPDTPESDAAKAKFVASAQERRASLRGQVGTIRRMQGRLRDAQRADGSDDADETKRVGQARQRHALVGALGVGMAMLAPLVGDALGLRCGTIDAPGTDATRDADADEAVRAAFTARVPLRLSEACLVVHSRMPTG